ncbi:sigma-70 family RNA polymerase sigma factor [Labilibaculum sp. A4]|uniref:RNA polymerase sigma factor n=1 Tax=Labilibaculum euxinus TaxID=2686357 RepID=UPI000F626905|nr:sigma-70 family RNA polymerase sigma factor [Labilibaculum euxinus]MDQ1772232.1 sigma-70 family RNA polymerase sigma factor [Labilibaculum euxinus]MWN77934.1 sigma-70 family RNA polymerase sigma factor [Labilibaculum euxinus]
MTQEEFKLLFDNHFDSIRNYIYYRSRDEELATDIAQDSFMKLWEKNLDFDEKPLRSLLYKIAGDLFISKYRREKVAQKYLVKLEPAIDNHSPEDQLAYQELTTKYETALDELSEKQRTVFLMSRMEGLKYQEIADRLELSVKAVEKRMSYALSYLRNALGR